MSKTLKMPDDTVEQINNKAKCFVADIADLEETIQTCRMQIEINREHLKSLYRKVRSITQKEIC